MVMRKALATNRRRWQSEHVFTLAAVALQTVELGQRQEAKLTGDRAAQLACDNGLILLREVLKLIRIRVFLVMITLLGLLVILATG